MRQPEIIRPRNEPSGPVPPGPSLDPDGRPFPLGAAFLEAYRALAERLHEAGDDARVVAPAFEDAAGDRS